MVTHMKRISALFLSFLLAGCAAVKTTPTQTYKTTIQIKEGGLATGKLVDATGKTILELFRNKAVPKGPLDVAWDGLDSD